MNHPQLGWLLGIPPFQITWEIPIIGFTMVYHIVCIYIYTIIQIERERSLWILIPWHNLSNLQNVKATPTVFFGRWKRPVPGRNWIQFCCSIPPQRQDLWWNYLQFKGVTKLITGGPHLEVDICVSLFLIQGFYPAFVFILCLIYQTIDTGCSTASPVYTVDN